MKNLIYFPMLFTTIAAILYPSWIVKGFLGFSDSDLIYPTIGSFIAIYGGMIASYRWWYLDVYKKNKK